MIRQTVGQPTANGVDSTAMEDETARVDETRIGATIEDTTVVDYPPTGGQELAWSSEDAWADFATVKEEHPRYRSLAHWLISLAAALAAGVAAVWFGLVLYHDEESTPPAAKPTTVKPTAEKPPAPIPTPAPSPTVPQPTLTIPAPVPPPAAEPPHGPSKYPWVAVVVSEPNAAGGQSVTYGFGTTQQAAVTGALRDCNAASRRECSPAASQANGCVAVALASGGSFESSVGPTRELALSSVRANFPAATSSYAFCSWDGNNS